MSALQVSDSYFLVTRHDVDYRREMIKHFAPFVDDPAARMFTKMVLKGFSYDAVPKTMLAFSPPPDLTPIAPVPADGLQRAGGPESLGSFVAALRTFAKRSRFNEFYDAHKSFYDQLVQRAQPSVNEAVAALEGYSGLPISNSTVILGPVLHEGGFGATIESSPPTIYAIIGPNGTEEGVPVFGSAQRMETLVQHEFCHSFVNPLTQHFGKEIEASSRLYTSIAQQTAQRAYADWETTVNEMIVRAVVCRLIAGARGEMETETCVASETSAGFKFVPLLANRLKEFEANRAKYRNLEEFYPRLIDVLSSAANRN